jgi:hypothetical protein
LAHFESRYKSDAGKTRPTDLPCVYFDEPVSVAAQLGWSTEIAWAGYFAAATFGDIRLQRPLDGGFGSATAAQNRGSNCDRSQYIIEIASFHAVSPRLTRILRQYMNI